MCGIAGFASRGARKLNRHLLENTMNSLEHRGPDDFGFLSLSDNVGMYAGREISRHFEDARLLLVHRRLSILDLSESGWQPMSSPDGRHHIIYNGEIYNYLELRSELQRHGYRFCSGTDTEVLLAAYCKWGTDVFRRLVGMFAFAIFDQQENSLLLARDFFGIKPLFYGSDADSFAFASEIKVLLDGFSLPRRANANRLYLYLRYGITDHGGETLFQDVRQLPPAHYLYVNLDSITVERPVRYWQIDCDETLDISFCEASRRLREMFLESVDLHLRSDVPLGAALSGGIDSSAIAMTMRHLRGDKLDLHFFSFIADDDRLSEERWIDLVGRASHAAVHKVRSNPDQLLADLKNVTSAHDEPIGSTSPYAQHRVFQLARKHGIKVMLDGQGADEILGGYRTYLGARLATLWRQRDFSGAFRFWSRCSHLPGTGKVGMTLLAADFLLPPRLQKSLRYLIGRQLAPRWLNMRWFAERGVAPAVLNYSTTKDVLRHHLGRELEELSLPHLLRYEDRNSMAFSIESRVPFLTPKLISFVLSLPEKYIISPQGESKAVFRAAMRGIVPDAILDRKDKIGFATPEKQWLTTLNPWVEETLASDAARRVQALDLAETSRDWQLTAAGKRRFDFRTWRCLNVIEWSRDYELNYE